MSEREYGPNWRSRKGSGRVYLVGLILVGIMAIAFLMNSQNELNTVQNRYNELYAKYNNLVGVVKYLNGSLSEQQRETDLLLQHYDRTSLVYRPASANSSVNIWGINQTVPAHGSIVWTLLDTFVNHVDISSNSPAEYLIMNLSNYVLFAQNRTFVSVKDYHGTHFLANERLSQGCATYVLVIKNISVAPILLKPNVTATYAPTDFLTGDCSLAP